MKKIILFTKLQDMPSDGWLHGCVMCEQITGSIDKVSIHDLKPSLYTQLVRHFHIRAYTCCRCNRNNKKYKNHYQSYCEKVKELLNERNICL